MHLLRAFMNGATCALENARICLHLVFQAYRIGLIE
jgi:hypothetical protein